MTTGVRPSLTSNAPLALLACLCALAMGACSSHQVRGVVIAGDASYVELVSKNDPRLTTGEPLPGASVQSVVDPQSLDKTRLPMVTTDIKGEFAIPIENFGAGWLEYELGVRVRRNEFAPAEGYVPLPGGGKRILVVLKPGRDAAANDRSAFGDDYSWERDLERFAH